MALNDLVPNPLQDINRAALASAQQTDQALRAQPQQSQQPQGDPYSNSNVSKAINSLIQKTSQQGAGPGPGGVPSGAFQPPSPDYLKTIQVAHNFHAAKQALAQSKLAEMSRQEQAGWLPDPKQMIKLIKQSGMKVDTSPEGIKTAVTYYSQYYGEKDPVTQESREMPKEIAAMKAKAESGELNKKDIQQFVMGAMVKNDMRSQRYAELSEQQKAKLEQRQMDVMDRATDEKLTPAERGAALGTLAIMNPQVAQMSKHFLDFAAATPEQRQFQIEVASGMEAPKDKIARADSLTNTFVNDWGGDPKLGRMYGDAVANNKPLPPEVVAAMPKVTPQNLQLTVMGVKALSEAGVSGDKLAAAVGALQMGGVKAVKDFLPAQTPTEIQQKYQESMLGISKQELQIKRGELGVEEGRLKIMQDEEASTIEERKAITAQREAMAKRLGVAPNNELLRSLQESIHTFAAIKNPSAAEKSLIQGVEDQYAEQLGLKPGVVKKGWFRDEMGYIANPSLVDPSLVGAPQTPENSRKPKEQNKGLVKTLEGISKKSAQAVDDTLFRPLWESPADKKKREEQQGKGRD